VLAEESRTYNYLKGLRQAPSSQRVRRHLQVNVPGQQRKKRDANITWVADITVVLVRQNCGCHASLTSRTSHPESELVERLLRKRIKFAASRTVPRDETSRHALDKHRFFLTTETLRPARNSHWKDLPELLDIGADGVNLHLGCPLVRRRDTPRPGSHLAGCG